MKSLILAVCTMLVVLWPIRAAAQAPAHADSPRVTITIDNPTLVGDTLVKPGSYKFQCRHIAGKSFLVLTDDRNKEVVRVPCTEELMPEKVADSQLRTTARDGHRVLQSVRIKGETIAHRLAN